MIRKAYRIWLGRSRLQYSERIFQNGFTLIETITVVVVLGVLSVYAAPRGFIGKDFYDKGFHDETLSYLRYAQKTAIAQRRTVCVSFTNDSLALAVASASGNSVASASGNLVCDAAMADVNGKIPATLSARSGTAYASLPADFNFNALGQPVNASNGVVPTQAWQVANTTRSIVVESDTGYVHE